jgi:hypothetical protein
MFFLLHTNILGGEMIFYMFFYILMMFFKGAL